MEETTRNPLTLMEEIQKCSSYLTEECKIPKEDVAMMLPLRMETKVVDNYCKPKCEFLKYCPEKKSF